MVNKLHPDIKAITEQLEKKYKELFFLELKQRLSSENFVAYCIVPVLRVFITMQAEYFGDNVDVANEDPTHLMPDYVPHIIAEIQEQLKASAATLDPVTGTFRLTLLSDEFLGIGESVGKNPPPIRWARFFMMGAFKENLIWVSNETAEKLKKHMSEGHAKNFETTNLGRFGVGHLWYGGDNVKLGAWFERAGLNIDDFVHPQSKKEGNPDWFKGVVEGLDLNTHLYLPAKAAADSKISI